MKIFISWSGKRSQMIAEGLNTWLPKVIQSIETFYSPEIEKGTRGGAEINASLEGTSFGIICLTPDNLDSTWIHYEAGALAKINANNTRVWTLLNDLKHSDVVQPLAQFQHTLTQKEDIYNLLKSINSHLEKPLLETHLRDTFEKWWTDLEEIIKETENIVSENQGTENIRTEREILNEMLELMRNQQRQINELKHISEISNPRKQLINRVDFYEKNLEIEFFISKKEDGLAEETEEEIRSFMSNWASGDVAQYSISERDKSFYIYFIFNFPTAKWFVKKFEDAAYKQFGDHLTGWVLHEK